MYVQKCTCRDACAEMHVQKCMCGDACAEMHVQKCMFRFLHPRGGLLVVVVVVVVVETDYPSLPSQPSPFPAPSPQPQPPAPAPYCGGECFRREPNRKKMGFSQGGSPSFRGVNLVKAQRWAFRLRHVAKTLKSEMFTVRGITLGRRPGPRPKTGIPFETCRANAEK